MESLVGDSLDVEETGNTSALKEGSQRGFTYGGLFWDARWEDDMDLYDDLNDWCWEGDEFQEKTLRKVWMIARIATVTVPGLITSKFHDHQPYYSLIRIY